MKTAVEWLADELCYITNSGRYIIDNTDDVTDVVNQAKEMEKEQIKTAYLNGNAFGIDIDNGLSPSHYYNQTFKQQEQ
jgi:hypothetical protein